MTDALSEWFIKEKEQALEIINSWNSHSDFIKSIDKLRFENRLHNDDSAILILDISNDGFQEINYQITHIDEIIELIANEKQEEVKAEEPKTISQSEIVSNPISEEENKIDTEKTPTIDNIEETLSDDYFNEQSAKAAEIYKKNHLKVKRDGKIHENVLETISKGVKEKAHSLATFLHLGNKKNSSEKQAVTEEIKSETTPTTVVILEIKTDNPDDIKKVIEEIKNEHKQKPKTENGKTSNTIINKF
jgi:hypothetical protein